METQYIDIVDHTPTILVNITGTRPPFRRIQCSTKKIDSLKDGVDLIDPILKKCPTAIITSIRIVQSNDPSFPGSRCRTNNPMFKHVPVNEELSVVRFMQHTTAKGLFDLRDKLTSNDCYEIAQWIQRNGAYTIETEAKTRETMFQIRERNARLTEDRDRKEKELEEKKRAEEGEEKEDELRARARARVEVAAEASEAERDEEEVEQEEENNDCDSDEQDVLDLSDDEEYVVITEEDICP